MLCSTQDTDGKRRVFVTQPTTPYEVGDLWTQGTAGDIMRCINARLSGAYVAGDWEKAVKYTDDTVVNNLQIGGVNLFIYKNLSSYNGGYILPVQAFYSLSNYKITATNQPLGSFLPGVQFNTGGQLKFKISGKSNLAAIIGYYKCFDENNNVTQNQTSTSQAVINGEFKLSIIVPASTAKINIGIGSNVVANYWVDEVKIEPGDKATAFFSIARRCRCRRNSEIKCCTNYSSGVRTC